MGACDVTVIIVDLEASSLLPGTFPIEVAWVFEDGSGEAHLIRPVAEWLDPARDNPGWSAQGEKIHGISLESAAQGAVSQLTLWHAGQQQCWRTRPW